MNEVVFSSKPKMKYVGIATQQSRNNMKSLLFLIAYPLLVLFLLFIGSHLFSYFIGVEYEETIPANDLFIFLFPWVTICIIIWFIIAYITNVKIVDYATGAQPLERKENRRVYNLVENLSISCGMRTPKIHIIESGALNAFASGLNHESYTITLTRGIIDKLDDKELEGVIAHELTHIRNNDVQVLIISIVFVGIFALLAEISMRSWRVVRNGKQVYVMIIMFLLAAVGYCVAMIMRFAISRNREYMADAGAAELTKNPLALAGALRKISGNSTMSSVQTEAVAQLFIDHHPNPLNASFLTSLYATHPPIEDRIKVLEQF